MRRVWLTVVLFFFCGAVPPPSSGSEPDHGGIEGRGEGTGHGAGGTHHVALFLGGTSKEVHHHTENTFTLGVEYSYRLNPWFGLAAMADFAGEEWEGFDADRGIEPIRVETYV